MTELAPRVRVLAMDPKSRANAHPAVRKLRTDEVLYVVGSAEDSLGRVYFTQYWLTDYRCGHPVREYDPEGRLLRAQCFHARLAPYVEESERRGYKVLVVGQK